MGYRFAFFDAQLLLVRTIKAQERHSPNGIVDRGNVMRTFLYSVWKVVREVGVDRPVLLWDSSPYHKSAILNERLSSREGDYKGDRWYVTEDDLVTMNKELEELESTLAQMMRDGASEEEKAELKEQLEKTRKIIEDGTRQVKNFQIRQSIKYYFIDVLGQFGMTSIIKKGWEADDIAYLMAKLVEHDNKKSLLVTTDTDWEYWINPNVDKYNNYAGKFVKYENVVARHQEIVDHYPEWDLFELKKHLDTIHGSHNNLHKTLAKEYHGKKMWEVLDNLDKAIIDRELYEAQLATWDFSIYPDYEFMSNCLVWYLEKGTLAPKHEFQKLIADNSMGMNVIHYEKFLQNIDQGLWQYD